MCSEIDPTEICVVEIEREICLLDIDPTDAVNKKSVIESIIKLQLLSSCEFWDFITHLFLQKLKHHSLSQVSSDTLAFSFKTLAMSQLNAAVVEAELALELSRLGPRILNFSGWLVLEFSLFQCIQCYRLLWPEAIDEYGFVSVLDSYFLNLDSELALELF
ncbi:hypothetical protein L6452_04972 [Arctium lappa]|uniref:Uncharacterized protein n=1 Tax=Arctium lappa TaxID=4217 RepID=A0ACB9EFF7_ARCLA|nr:hypothetical protein L6452_04972 [Arctium lappa]